MGRLVPTTGTSCLTALVIAGIVAFLLFVSILGFLIALLAAIGSVWDTTATLWPDVLGLTIALTAAGTVGFVIYRALRHPLIEWDGKRCYRCDYDLTGNTTGICSECGEHFAEKTADKA